MLCRKKWFSILRVKVTASAYMIKIWLFILHLLNFRCFDLIVHHNKPQCPLKKNPLLRSRSQRSVCPDNISWTAWTCVTKLGIVVYYHEPECCVEKLVRCLQGQGHSEGIYFQNMSVSTICSNLLIDNPFATGRELVVHHHQTECLMRKIGLLR